MKQGIIFDLDGTLMDTSEGVIHSVKYLLKRLGYIMPDNDTLKTFIGPPIKNRLIDLYNMPEDDALQAHMLFRKYYAEGDIYMAKAYDGIAEVLKAFRISGCKLGVATNKREDHAILLLHRYGLDKYFDVIRGTDIRGNYTKSDVIEMAISGLSVEKKDVVMIGDSTNDALAAENVGVEFIAVTYGFGFKTEEQIRKYPHIGVASNCKQIYSIICDMH